MCQVCVSRPMDPAGDGPRGPWNWHRLSSWIEIQKSNGSKRAFANHRPPHHPCVRPVLPPALRASIGPAQNRNDAFWRVMGGRLEIVHDTRWAGRRTAGRLPVDCLETVWRWTLSRERQRYSHIDAVHAHRKADSPMSLFIAFP